MKLTIDDFKQKPCDDKWGVYVDSNYDESVVYENIEWVFVNIKDPKKLLKFDKIKFENGFYFIKNIYLLIKYNYKENKIIREFHDKERKLIGGIARFVYKYNDSGDLILEECYDKDGKLKGNDNGIARFVYKYNGEGDVIMSELYDENGVKL